MPTVDSLKVEFGGRTLFSDVSFSVNENDKIVLMGENGAGKSTLSGRSLIIQLMNLNLIDEYQLCVHPVVVGKGLPLFEKINDRTTFTLLKTKIFNSGAIILYYKRN